jgi:hypothetical protein
MEDTMDISKATDDELQIEILRRQFAVEDLGRLKNWAIELKESIRIKKIVLAELNRAIKNREKEEVK